MRDYVLELAAKQSGMNAKLNTMREYLQAYILRIMHEEGIFSSTAFIGGTALRFLYNLPRYSQDLDFSLETGRKPSFILLMRRIKSELSLAGYDVSITFNDKRIVQSAFIKFKGLVKDAGISPLAEQNLSVKIELDTNPPRGAATETKVVNKYFPFAFLTYTKDSLFAGKLHAVLSREYTKGRDFFDIGWYLSKWEGLSPNITLLTNALKQTGWKKPYPAEDTWRDIIYEAVQKADWRKVKKDVENFLERPRDLDIFTKENLISLLKKA